MKIHAKTMAAAPRVAAVVLLALMAALAGSAAFNESMAIDEVAHIGAGVSCLQKLDLRMNAEHPPLAKVLAALPLAARGARADYNGYIWTWSGQGPFNAFLAEWPFGAWFITHWNNPYTTLRWARLPMLGLMLVLGAAICRFGERLADGWGGVFALCWFATMPAFLAFGPLVLTDMVVALFSLVALWNLAAMWRDPSPRATRWFALALAAALLSKFSAGLLLFAFAAFPFTLRWRPVQGQPAGAEFRAWWRRGWLNTLKGMLLAALVVYAVVFALSWNQPTDLLQAIGHGSVALALRRLLLPLVTYLGGILVFALGASRPTFILGHTYPHGVWFYFPVLVLLKSTLAFLAALGLGVVTAIAARIGRPRASAVSARMQFHWRALCVGLVVFTAACLLSPMDISIRHFSVPLVLMALLLAPVPRLLAQMARPMVWIAAGLAVVSVVTVVRAWPYYFPFMNSLAFGRPAYDLVNDSNVDWDTELPEVERFVQSHGLEHVLIDPYNITDPSVWVPQARFWDCQAAGPADAGMWAFVSAGMIRDGHNCSWLLSYPHEAVAGGSMYAFRLPAPIPLPGAPGGPPLPVHYRHFGGAPFDIRQLLSDTIRDPRRLPEAMETLKHAPH